MGRSHALTGTLAYQVVTLYQPQSIAQQILGTVICTGAALFPDIDHPQATTSSTYGPVTRALSWVIRKLSGGHREGTHSFLGIALLAYSAHVAIRYQPNPLANAWICALMVLAMAGAVRLFHIDGYIDDLMPIPVALALAWLRPVGLEYVPVALGVGALVHVFGDMLTKQKVKVLWPFGSKGYAMYLFKTNGRIERWLILPLICLAIVGVTGWRFV